MIKKHFILIGTAITLLLMTTAAMFYPGGSMFDKHSVGYSWRYNYVSNLFGEDAINGMPNPGRYWALCSMIFLSATCSLFFIEFSRKIPDARAAKIIRYSGITSMVFAVFIATPLHDLMISISSSIFLLSTFYITVFIFKSRLHLFKWLAVLYLAGFYGTLYIYNSGDLLEYLAVIQKALFAMTVVVVLALNYGTKATDFVPKKDVTHATDN
ncbi:hypothetical protein [Flavobacterium sp.]|uniref:hypothetical protein n=1 Tax=Flavobacterium sp. TaxID=239 RepID=UPI00262F7FF6|nr:hypothetical protein [Flavobacterium sp.]